MIILDNSSLLSKKDVLRHDLTSGSFVKM